MEQCLSPESVLAMDANGELPSGATALWEKKHPKVRNEATSCIRKRLWYYTAAAACMLYTVVAWFWLLDYEVLRLQREMVPPDMATRAAVNAVVLISAIMGLFVSIILYVSADGSVHNYRYVDGFGSNYPDLVGWLGLNVEKLRSKPERVQLRYLQLRANARLHSVTLSIARLQQAAGFTPVEIEKKEAKDQLMADLKAIYDVLHRFSLADGGYRPYFAWANKKLLRTTA